RHLRGEAVVARPDNPLQRLSRFVGHHKLASLVVIMILFVLGAGGVVATLVAEQQALMQARRHEQRIDAFHKAVERQSQAMDDQFHHYESILSALAGRAREIINRASPPEDLAVLFNEDFPAVPLDMLVPSSFYKQRISLTAPVIKVAPGVR